MIDHSECIRVGYLDPEISDIFAVKQNCLSIPYLLFVWHPECFYLRKSSPNILNGLILKAIMLSSYSWITPSWHIGLDKQAFWVLRIFPRREEKSWGCSLKIALFNVNLLSVIYLHLRISQRAHFLYRYLSGFGNINIGTSDIVSSWCLW